MGEQFLNDVLAALRNGGWRAEAGYPGTGTAAPETPVAAVNFSRFNAREQEAEVTVSVLVPGKQGLALCQRLAAQAGSMLAAVGGDWGFDGWSYDGRLDCFRVDLKGNTRIAAERGKNYEVLIGETVQDWVTKFSAKKDMQRRIYRPHGQPEPAGVTAGKSGWCVELVQLLPFGSVEPEETADGFVLTVRSEEAGMKYLGCCWSEYESSQCADGIRVLRRGFALGREAV